MEDRSLLALRLRGLECFRGIMETGSATGAARRLRLSQPAVSRLLGVLEGELGYTLFQRDRGRLLPTVEAHLLYKEVDIALQSVERVAQLARNLRNANYGELSIVSPPSLSEGILPRIIAEFISAHPEIHVTLDSESVEKARDMVALRAVDCGFVKKPVDHPGLALETLARSGTVCAMSADHRLAKKRTVSAADLHGEPLILLGKGRASRVEVDQVFREAGVRMNVKVDTHTVASACAFARSGTGVAIVNEMMAVHYASPSLVLRRFEPNLVHEYAFMTARETPMSRVTRSFLEHCRRFLSAERKGLGLLKLSSAEAEERRDG